jgi:hypothetical protein
LENAPAGIAQSHLQDLQDSAVFLAAPSRALLSVDLGSAAI